MLATGDRLGRYEILGELGAGAMGEVYRARDTSLDREVAIKVLPVAMARDPERLRRFEREAKAVAKLAHPNILEIWDYGSDDDVNYAVTELLDGETVRDRLSQGPLQWSDAAELGASIADGLAAAHREGVVHRDIKPTNLFLTSDSRVKILDFGLAAVRARAAAKDEANGPGSTLTEDGKVIGTVGYMAPEQVRGESVDHRADIFALGCVMYETVTGQRAFGRETTAETMTAILNDQPAEMSSSGVFPPPGLERSVRRCLEKRPDDRFQSAADLAHTLREMSMISAPRFARLRHSPRRWIRKALWAVPGAIALVAVALVLWILVLTTEDQLKPVRRYSINLPESAPLQPSGVLYPEPPLAVSPDGEWLVYVAGKRPFSKLMRRRLDGVEVAPIDGAETGVSSPFFAPDGRWVGFRRFGNGPERILLTGGIAEDCRSPTESTILLGASWRDDGFIVFGGGPPPGIYRIPEDGGAFGPEVLADRTIGERTLEFPEPLPGGDGMLLAVSQVTSDRPSLYLAAQRSSGKRTVLAEGAPFGRFATSGHVVYPSKMGRLMALPFDPENLEPIGEPSEVSEPGMGNPPYEWSFSRDGTLVYASVTPEQRPKYTLAFVDEIGEEDPISIPDYLRADWLRVSPDGRRVAMALQHVGARVKNIWLYDLDIDGRSWVTLDADIEEFPIWTPDGEKIVFTSNQGGKADLYWKPVDTDAPAVRLTDMDPRLVPIAYSFSPDGETLFFWDWGPSEVGCDLWTVSVNEDPPRVERLKSVEGCAWQPAISPDGRWMVADRLGNSPVWHPDGSSIFYLDLWGNIVEVEVRTEPKISFRPYRVVQEGTFDSLDITPDGERFLVIKAELGEPITELVVVENWFEELKRKAPPSR
jgi:serine/threonine protein kinase/sugar lactone lactonase YvrE